MLEIRSFFLRHRVTFTSCVMGILPISAAQAHWGHLGDLAGHAHVAGVALAGIAVVLGAGLAVKGKKKSDDASDAAEAEPEMEIEPANG